ncbi:MULTISPECIES: glycosyltransferase family 2 protein [unclassified Pseudomonas]|uniref:glycosyltransferase family 2 protein n=1 Tax=unclassified Pseudomonas TaxID=196821 RepID=UPI00070399AB|nr:MULTISPECIES: glycosyltransferase family 2 protein [unclassified Pseudomonas]KQZ78516.1 glycosyl transferase [Pseudomonas sp. Root562]
MKLSIVATLYSSARFIEQFHLRASQAAQQMVGDDYEIVLVNDGSPDSSLELAVQLSEADHHVVVVDLSRNFGHHKAMMTGLQHARGERVFLLDSDLEEDPAWLLSFSEQMEREKVDVVYGVQQQRKGRHFERWTGHVFYKLFRFLSGLDMPDNIVVARLMSRRYVDALIQHDERELFMAGLWVITGFDQRAQSIVKHSRDETTYTLGKKVAQLVNSITAFSSAPLVGIFGVGCAIFLLSAAYTSFLFVNWLLLANPPSGYTSLMASIWLLGGLIIAFVGVVGIYLAKIYSEVKQRPYTIVRNVYRQAKTRSIE